MSIIRLTPSIASHPDLERLHLFPGRHLGEVEFDRLQNYADYRLQQLGLTTRPGILRGLEVVSPTSAPLAEEITVSAGIGVNGAGQLLGLANQLRVAWHTLVHDHLLENEVSDARGVYYLVLERSSGTLDGSADEVMPCRRQDPDPLRDLQKVVTGRLGLRRLAVSNSDLATLDADTIANRICGLQANAELFAQLCDELKTHAASSNDSAVCMGDARDELFRQLPNVLPLALLAIREVDQRIPSWLLPEAGRYLAIEDTAAKTLQRHHQLSLKRVVRQIYREAPGQNFGDAFEARMANRYLPAIGPLPVQLLEDPDSLENPNIRWLPGHLNLDMVPVPESTLPGLIERETARGVIDLAQPGQRARLLLAVKDRDYRPDLLDFPEADHGIEDDVYLYDQRAHNAWIAWKEQFYALYYMLDKDQLSDEQQAQLQLPKPVKWPLPAQEYFDHLILREKAERGIANTADLPLPYRLGAPAAPAEYTDWLDDGERLPLARRPDHNGLSVEYILNDVEIEDLDNSLRDKRKLLNQIRDLLELQRQQLDSNTVSMATLAGGVSTDGSGLQIARWWPHMEFNTDDLPTDTVDTPPEEPAPPEEATAVTGAFTYTPYFYTPQLLNFTAKPSSPIEPVSTPKVASKTSVPTSSFALNLPLFNFTEKFKLLDQVVTETKQKASDPQFQVETKQFGVLKHLLPETSEYRTAWEGLQDIFELYEDIFGSADLAALQSKFDPKGLYLRTPEVVESEGTSENAKTSLRNKALFRLSRFLTRFVSYTENKNDDLLRSILQTQKELKRRHGLRESLARQIREATNKLISLDRVRLEYLGDYNMAQALCEEEWQRVEQVHDERTRILTSLTGLYCIKVRRTPVSRIITRTRDLVVPQEGALLPACNVDSGAELPDALDMFYEAVLELPLQSWQALDEYLHLLPGRGIITKLDRFRKQRLQTKSQYGVYRQASYFSPLIQQTRSLLFDYANRTTQLDRSISKVHAQVRQNFSLEDMHSLPAGKLRKQAAQLREQLGQSLTCMLDHLRRISPSVRMNWAQLAEDDRMPLTPGVAWPGLDEAQSKDMEPARVVTTLAGWWFAQLGSAAAGQAQTAMRNMLRAVLIEAALGEPDEIVRGVIHTLPPRFKPGEILRLKLNREVRPGMNLQLLNPKQQVVGSVQIEDEDEQGAVAKITAINVQQTVLTTQFTVVQNSKRQVNMGRL